jgi:hypothetical protein
MSSSLLLSFSGLFGAGGVVVVAVLSLAAGFIGGFIVARVAFNPYG